MKISLIISAHNEEQRIGTCLGSIQKALKAYPCDAETIVVANACTDHTAAIARGFPGVRVIEEPRKGLTRARQAGFDISRGELIANLDADIVMPAGWLPYVLTTFEKNPKLLALSGPFIYYDLPLYARAWVRLFYVITYLTYLVTHYVLRVGSMLQGGNFVVRREALKKIGGFDTSIKFYGEDVDVARRLRKLGDIRWTFKLPMNTSGRRLQKEGLVKMGLRYALNYLWTTFTARPWSETYTDVRTDVR